MNLVRKLELARMAIASITRHDDASDAELAEAGNQVREFLRAELSEAAQRRAAREATRMAALKGKGDGDSH